MDLNTQVKMLKEAINDGIIDKNGPIIQEQKNGLIDLFYHVNQIRGNDVSKSEIGAIIDKAFADYLDIE